MELKDYQAKVLKDLEHFLEALEQPGATPSSAYQRHWENRGVAVGVAVKPYRDGLSGAPQICFKVPTGGGKTFLACCALLPLMERLGKTGPQVVVWLVPSNAILAQTVKALQDMSHPYRRRIQADFNGRVEVYTKEQLLQGQDFNPVSVQEQISICVLSYDSLRAAKKDGRLVYRENSALAGFAKYYQLDGETSVEGADETSLMQALHLMNPVVVVDESHNAGSRLSVEMLKNLNPHFVLDLTATPAKNSNIISYVDAAALKKEEMVKLPVVVYNRDHKNDVVLTALRLQKALETLAQKEQKSSGRYLRPIVLFQAQTKAGRTSHTYKKLKNDLLESGIPPEQVKIKTGDVDELKDLDLLSPGCPVRYIITVNALKEGWDCPFAYILATIANRSSPVEVEQIVGRVLRQPHAKRFKEPLLNNSYVLTSSDDFSATLDSVVLGLNNAGFSSRDYVASQNLSPEAPSASTAPQALHPQEEQLDIGRIKNAFENLENKAESRPSDDEFRSFLDLAREEGARYEEEVQQADKSPLPMEVRALMNFYPIQTQYRESAEQLLIPQFILAHEAKLLDDSSPRLSKEQLMEGFNLNTKDAEISFDLFAGQAAQVDADAGGTPRVRYYTARDSARIFGALRTSSDSEKLETIKQQVLSIIRQGEDAIPDKDLKTYITRVVDAMDEDTRSALFNHFPEYARRIKEKIDALKATHRQTQFKQQLATGKITCVPDQGFQLSDKISLSGRVSSIDKSLYTFEDGEMTAPENKIISQVAGLDNVLWWHRNLERREFFLNGPINHYPDFIVYTKKETLLLLEVKGMQLANVDSAAKIRLGRAWQDKLGERYKYLMVFDEASAPLEGAYPLSEALNIIHSW